MDNMNKVISFILGLVVVVVFVAILAGRIGPFQNLFGRKGSTPSPTPSVTVIPSVNPTIVASGSNEASGQTGSTYQSNTGTKNPTITTYQTKANSIPSTGSETLLLPLFGSIGLLGAHIRAKGRKTS